MKDLRILVIALVVGLGILSQATQPVSANFHIMRVWEVMGGAYGNADIQYVELRMASAGQNFLAGHEICFFNSSGTAKARLEFTDVGGPFVPEVPNGSAGASILIGSSEFDTAWAAGSPDFVFGGAGSTMTALNGGDASHPVQSPGGKVGFGDYDAGCAPAFAGAVIDSVAYGGFGDTVELPPAEPSSLPTSGTQGLKLVTALCHPSSGAMCPRANQTDYDVVDVNTPAGNNPRNNAGTASPVGAIIKPGNAYYETPSAFQDFSSTPISGGFFEPGSDPFAGTITLKGQPLGPIGTQGLADTIVQRRSPVTLNPPLPASGTIPIEIVALNLVSVNPITVTGGTGPHQWNVKVDLSPGNPSQGQKQPIVQNNGTGGTFDSQILVKPRFTFTRVDPGPPPATQVMDPAPPLQFQSTGTPWVFECPPGYVVVPGSSTNFCPGIVGTNRMQETLQASNGQQIIVPACYDPDLDGVGTCVDNCPNVANAGQADGDTDGVGDACDNCPATPNANQANFDGDALGDDCDADDDNDLVNDVDEGPCGAQPLNASSRPERLDTAGDDDLDGMFNEALPSGSSGFDCDGDGWNGNQENLIYNDAPSTARDQDPCGNNGWPADVDPDNKLNIGDINSFTTPTRPNADHPYTDSHGSFNKFGHTLDDAPPTDGAIDPLMARWNLDTPPHLTTTQIDIGDLNAINPGVSASTSRPPMFGGQPAFFTNGGQCPYAP